MTAAPGCCRPTASGSAKTCKRKIRRLKIYPLTPSVAISTESAANGVNALAGILYRRARADNLVRVAQSWNEALEEQGAARNIRVTAERLFAARRERRSLPRVSEEIVLGGL